MDTKATGALIASRRKSLALSQAELAERLHVTDKAVSRWETGRGMPGLDSLEPLSEVLGLSVSELLSGKELTVEELPGEAEGQIMESMKRERKWKWTAWLLAAAAVLLPVVIGIGMFVQTQREQARAEQEQAVRREHYFASVSGHDFEALAEATADYFEEQGAKTRFNRQSLRVREHTTEKDYMALLLSDRAGEWCMSLWLKDEVFPERYHMIGGRSQMKAGPEGLMSWNFGDRENGIIVTSGAELPEDAEYYEWHSGSTIYKRSVLWRTHTVLDIYLMPLPDWIEPAYSQPWLCE